MTDFNDVHEYGWNLVHKLHDMAVCYVLNQSDHNEDGLNFKSQYHAEGSVLTHTMMVYSHVMRNFIEDDFFPNTWKELIIASLLHDIGKPYCREWVEDKHRIMFKNHAGVSTFKAISDIKKLDPTLTVDQIVYILRLINYHGDLFDVKPKHWVKWKKSKNFLIDLYSLRKADCFGNISKKYPFADSWYFIIELLDHISEHSKYPCPPPKKDYATATFLIGLPNSGKTTYALKEGYNNILSRDQMVLDLAGTDNYDDAWKRVDQKEVDKEFRESFQYLLKNEYDMVIDRTNLTRKGRMKFVNQLRQKGYKISYKVFLPELSTIYNRNTLRENKFIPYNVILNMMKSFKMPYDDEFDEIEYLL